MCILLLVWFLHGDSIGSSIDDLLLKSMVLIHRSTSTSAPMDVCGSSDCISIPRYEVLKVHKRENFLGSDFEICTFS